MRKAALVAAGALALPLVLSLPAAAAGLIERAQDEGMRQARQAQQQAGGRKHLGSDRVQHRSTNGASTTGAAPPDRYQAQAEVQVQASKSDSDDAKGIKQ